MTIPHSRPWVGTGEQVAVETTLRSGMIAAGPQVDAFERAMATYVGLPVAAATASGTAALIVALAAVDVGPGSQVVIPTYVCRAVMDAVVSLGATPVLCDVGDDWCMTAATVDAVLTPQVRAIVVVHPFGVVADVDSINRLGPPVIEDCCQSLGAVDGGSMVGTRGRLCCLSFHATKLLTTGTGGMVLGGPGALAALDRSAVAPAVQGVRAAGPFTDLQAALGLAQLARYGDMIGRRALIAQEYRRAIDGSPAWMPTRAGQRNLYFRFAVRHPHGFERAQAAFAALGITVRRGVDALLHRMLGLPGERFPVAETLFAETVSVPLYPALTDPEVAQVAEACARVFRA